MAERLASEAVSGPPLEDREQAFMAVQEGEEPSSENRDQEYQMPVGTEPQGMWSENPSVAGTGTRRPGIGTSGDHNNGPNDEAVDDPIASLMK